MSSWGCAVAHIQISSAIWVDLPSVKHALRDFWPVKPSDQRKIKAADIAWWALGNCKISLAGLLHAGHFYDRHCSWSASRANRCMRPFKFYYKLRTEHVHSFISACHVSWYCVTVLLFTRVQPYSGGVMHSVAWVCLFVCMFVCHTITFKSLELGSSFLLRRYVFKKCRSSSYIKMFTIKYRALLLTGNVKYPISYVQNVANYSSSTLSLIIFIRHKGRKVHKSQKPTLLSQIYLNVKL